MKKILLVVLISIICLASAWCAISYRIDDYLVQVVVGKNAVHFINEEIGMNFTSYAHGFYRDIPVDFEGSPVNARVSKVSCSDKFSAEYSNGYYSMKIGDADTTISGLKNYEISYNYDLGIDTNEGYDEFYFDLLGDAWECSTSNFRYEVYLPKEGLSLDDVKVWVTAGSYGSSGQLEYSVAEYQDYYVFYGQAQNLRRGQAVTMRIQLPEGWYVGAREPWDARETFSVIAPYLSVVLVIVAYILWACFGKDKKPIITARFEAPEGYSPMIVGFLADNIVDDKDIIAMIFNWADRGLLTINEIKKDKFTFTKKSEINPDVPKAEYDLFNAFFRRCRVGETITLTDIQNSNFAAAMLKAKADIAIYFTKERALHSKKARALGVLTGFAVIVPYLLLSAACCLTEYSMDGFFVCFVISVISTVINITCQWGLFRKWYIRKSNIGACIVCSIPAILNILIFLGISQNIVLTLVCCLSSFLLSVFTIIMGKKSEFGQKLFEEVLGYREFIDKVSMDELRMMIDKDPQIYYKVLSYAVVLGLEEKWAKKFSGIAIQPPTWYIGSNMSDIMFYSHMASRMRHVIAMNSVPVNAGKAVGGSGFNISGFAGGGFGGGGGRAW